MRNELLMLRNSSDLDAIVLNADDEEAFQTVGGKGFAPNSRPEFALISLNDPELASPVVAGCLASLHQVEPLRLAGSPM